MQHAVIARTSRAGSRRCPVQEFTIYNQKDIAAGLQNFLICIEMFPAAVSHAYAFPPKDYLDPSQQQRRGVVQSLRAMFDVRDVFEDMNLVMDDTVRTCWLTGQHGILALG